jgi:hypothetical protein
MHFKDGLSWYWMRGIKIVFNDHPVALDVHRAPKLSAINQGKALWISIKTATSSYHSLYASSSTDS